jgi:hypothetical protein
VLHDAVVLVRGFNELAAFVDIVRSGLFNVDVLTGLAGPYGGQRVPVVGRRDGDRVNRLVLEDLTQILFDRRFAAVALLEFSLALFEQVAIRVAEHGDFSIRQVAKASNVIFAPAVDTEDCDLDFVAGGGFGGVLEQLSSSGSAGGGQERSTRVHLQVSSSFTGGSPP